MRNVGLKNIFEFLRAGRVGARIGGLSTTLYDDFLVSNGGSHQAFNVGPSNETFRVRQ